MRAPGRVYYGQIRKEPRYWLYSLQGGEVMSAVAGVETNVLSLHPMNLAITDTDTGINQRVELRTDEIWRLNGDNRWRMVICVRGEIWITQECDIEDYVLTAGDIFVITRPGSVLVEGLYDAVVEFTPSLKHAPYRGGFKFFD